jgi:hypothetical protein
MADIEAEIAEYDKQKADLEKKHMGKWVLFHDLQLIGVFESFEAAAKEAVAKFGRGPYLIRQVGAPPVTLPVSVFYGLAYA